MQANRTVRMTLTRKPTTEGAGVHLHRAFGFGATDEFDPFLLLDDLVERTQNLRVVMRSEVWALVESTSAP